MRIAGVIKESVVDGPGVRYVVFAQGCPHHCPGCQNPNTWDFQGGSLETPRSLLKEIKKAPAYVKGVTLSGGEPFGQAGEMADLARRIHDLGKDVVTYTGYLYEELLKLAQTTPDIKHLLEETDILVDGPFLEAQKDLSLAFRGSSNQRVILVKESLEQQKVVLWEPGQRRCEAK